MNNLNELIKKRKEIEYRLNQHRYYKQSLTDLLFIKQAIKDLIQLKNELRDLKPIQ